MSALLYGSQPNPPEGCEAAAAYRLFVSIKEKWVLQTSNAVGLAEHIAPVEYASSHGTLKGRPCLVHHIHFLGVVPRTQRTVVVKKSLFTAKNEPRDYTLSKNCSDFFHSCLAALLLATSTW